MFTNLPEFQTNLHEFSELVSKENKRRVIEIMVHLYKLVQSRTPVYSGPDFPGGHAASNWRVSNDLKDDVLGTRQKPTRKIPAETIRTYLGSMRTGETLWLFNNVHYMVYLNAGHSMQAPAYFIEIAIEDTLNYMASKGWA